jgi:hypothetical protein
MGKILSDSVDLARSVRTGGGGVDVHRLTFAERVARSIEPLGGRAAWRWSRLAVQLERRVSQVRRPERFGVGWRVHRIPARRCGRLR